MVVHNISNNLHPDSLATAQKAVADGFVYDIVPSSAFKEDAGWYVVLYSQKHANEVFLFAWTSHEECEKLVDLLYHKP